MKHFQGYHRKVVEGVKGRRREARDTQRVTHDRQKRRQHRLLPTPPLPDHRGGGMAQWHSKSFDHRDAVHGEENCGGVEAAAMSTSE